MVRIIIALSMIHGTAFAVEEDGGGWLLGVRRGQPSSLLLHLNDDIVASFGGSRSSPGYSLAYNSSSTRFEWRSTNCDGSGTGCVPFYVADGTDDVVLSGDLTLGGDTSLSTPADGGLLVANDAGTQGVEFDTYTAAGVLTLRNESGTPAVDIVMGARQIYFGSGASALVQRIGASGNYLGFVGYYGLQFKHIGDLDVASRGLFEFGQANAAYEITGSSGIQYGMSIGNSAFGFEVNQSGTAGYEALHIDVTETSTGSGDSYLIRAGVNESPLFGVTSAGVLEVAPYTRHLDIDMTAATVGATAPTAVTVGQLRCLQFTQTTTAETSHGHRELSTDWTGDTDMSFGLYWYAESGDALQDGETVTWDVTYRSLAELDPYDNGTAVTVQVAHTQSGAGTDKGGYRTFATLDYDDANQPLAAGDNFAVTIDLNEGATSYSGNPILCTAEIQYQSNTFAEH